MLGYIMFLALSFILGLLTREIIELLEKKEVRKTRFFR